MIPSNGGIRGQIEDIRQVVSGVEFRGLKIQNGRDENDAIQIHAVTLLEIPGKPRGARGAVAFAGEEFRGRPALVARGVEPDEIRDGLHVFFNPVKLLGRFAGNGAAVAGRNGIDENEIAKVEKRRIVVNELVGRRKERARIPHLHTTRAKQA